MSSIEKVSDSYKTTLIRRLKSISRSYWTTDKLLNPFLPRISRRLIKGKGQQFSALYWLLWTESKTAGSSTLTLDPRYIKYIGRDVMVVSFMSWVLKTVLSQLFLPFVAYMNGLVFHLDSLKLLMYHKDVWKNIWKGWDILHPLSRWHSGLWQDF